MDRGTILKDWERQRGEFEAFAAQLDTIADAVSVTQAFTPVPAALFSAFRIEVETLTAMAEEMSNAIQKSDGREIGETLLKVQKQYGRAKQLYDALQREIGLASQGHPFRSADPGNP